MLNSSKIAPESVNNCEAEPRRPMVTPFARALSLLATFTPEDTWLCNGELAQRTGLPPSTVTRMTRTLVTLGYLRCATDTRKLRLSSAALTLGYRAAVDADIQHTANEHMRAFAERHEVHIHLSTRERLDLVVIDSCRTNTLPTSLQPGIGTRQGLVSSPAGWALLAGLPEPERNYLLQSALHRPAPEWSRLRRRSSEAIGQVLEGGFCVAVGESGQPMTVVAAPILLPGSATLAVSCMRPSMLTGRKEHTRELGPALVRMTHEIQSSKMQA